MRLSNGADLHAEVGSCCHNGTAVLTFANLTLVLPEPSDCYVVELFGVAALPRREPHRLRLYPRKRRPAAASRASFCPHDFFRYESIDGVMSRIRRSRPRS